MSRASDISRAIATARRQQNALTRMDKNCTPGKTEPCGKACRKIGTCKQKSKTPASTPATAPKATKQAKNPADTIVSKPSPPSANQARKFARRTPEQQYRSLAKDPKTAQILDLLTGKKISDKKIREATGMSQDDLINAVAGIRSRLGIEADMDMRSQLKKLKKGAAYRRDSLLDRIDSLLEALYA